MVISLAPAAQTSADDAQIENLLDLTFGLSRRTKTSYRLREGSVPADGLSRVIRQAKIGVVGAISFWPLRIGTAGTSALLLGPLVVHPQRQNIGIGRALMHEGIARASAKGHQMILLIGDQSYYGRVGFRQVPERQIEVPGPIDAKRLLYLELQVGVLAKARGLMLADWRWRELNALRAAT